MSHILQNIAFNWSLVQLLEHHIQNLTPLKNYHLLLRIFSGRAEDDIYLTVFTLRTDNCYIQCLQIFSSGYPQKNFTLAFLLFCNFVRVTQVRLSQYWLVYLGKPKTKVKFFCGDPVGIFREARILKRQMEFFTIGGVVVVGKECQIP